MKNYFITFLLALLVVMTGVMLRRGIASIGGAPVPPIPKMAIGGAPVPPIPKLAIGGAPVPPIPPRRAEQVEIR